jgi:hypothetical protein
MRVKNLSATTDRNPATVPVAADTYDVTGFPATTRVTGLYPWGNYLIAAEVRATGVAATQGVWLEVFKAEKVRDEQSATSLTLADSVGSYQVTAATPTSQWWVDVTMTDGRAVVAADLGPNAAAGNYLFFVDLRPLLDDSSLTVLTADSLQGSVSPVPSVRRGVIQGSYAYVATAAGFYVIDVTNVMDEDPLTKLPAVPTFTSLYNSSGFYDVDVYGSIAILSPSAGANGVYSVDISTPLSPATQGLFPFVPGTASCTPPLEATNRTMRNNLALAGTRAYMEAISGLYVIELE